MVTSDVTTDHQESAVGKERVSGAEEQCWTRYVMKVFVLGSQTRGTPDSALPQASTFPLGIRFMCTATMGQLSTSLQEPVSAAVAFVKDGTAAPVAHGIAPFARDFTLRSPR